MHILSIVSSKKRDIVFENRNPLNLGTTTDIREDIKSMHQDIFTSSVLLMAPQSP